MTSTFVQDTCLLLRHDGCKKGTYPKGGRCVPAKGRQSSKGKQAGNGKRKGMTGGQIAATAIGGTLAAGAIGAGIYGSTRHGQRNIGKLEEKAGRFINNRAKEWDEGTNITEERLRESGHYSEKDIARARKSNDRVSSAARNLGDQWRRSGKMRQAANRNPNATGWRPSTKLETRPVSGKSAPGSALARPLARRGGSDFVEGEYRTVKGISGSSDKKKIKGSNSPKNLKGS